MSTLVVTGCVLLPDEELERVSNELAAAHVWLRAEDTPVFILENLNKRKEKKTERVRKKRACLKCGGLGHYAKTCTNRLGPL